jgi:hypothetical protein
VLLFASGYSTPTATKWCEVPKPLLQDSETVSGYNIPYLFPRFKVPGLDEPLYGYLVLYGLPDSVAATGGYEIQVPQTYVDATSNGRVSLVYEQDNAHFLWLLCLSRTPFGK